MKAGFWIAPEGGDTPMTMMPLGISEDTGLGFRSATGSPAFLATAEAEELIARCPSAAALIGDLVDALNRQKADAPGKVFDLAPMNADERELIAQVLGEGEVAATVALPEGVIAQVQESVLAGLWRVRFLDANGVLMAECVEVTAIPEVVTRAAGMTSDELVIMPAPEGTMNVMPVLAEVRERMATWRTGEANHTITFSLFPMNPDDMDFLQKSLGPGPVQIISRGYGTCKVTATATRNVWSVQYFNAMDTIVLDTLEIGGVPSVALAAEDDMRDSAERLKEIEEAYFH